MLATSSVDKLDNSPSHYRDRVYEPVIIKNDYP